MRITRDNDYVHTNPTGKSIQDQNLDLKAWDAKFLEGQLQFGKAGRGIEHGMRKDATYDGEVWRR